jgi:hypothetical protein
VTGKFRSLLDAAARSLVPVKTSSRLYLEQALGKFGIVGLPKDALQELADDAVHLAKVGACLQNRNWRDGVTNWLDGQAGNVACLLNDDRDASGRQRVTDDMREKLAAILDKHTVIVPPVGTTKAMR